MVTCKWTNRDGVRVVGIHKVFCFFVWPSLCLYLSFMVSIHFLLLCFLIPVDLGISSFFFFSSSSPILLSYYTLVRQAEFERRAQYNVTVQQVAGYVLRCGG